MILGNNRYKFFFRGRLTSNIGDSFVFQMIPLLLLTLDNSELWISINGFVQYLPYLLIPLIAYKFDHLRDKKKYLVISEGINLVLTVMLLASIILGVNAVVIIILAGAYYFSIAALYNVQNSFLKLLVQEEDIIDFFRMYELTGTIIDVILDAIATFIIQVIGFVWSLVLNVCTFTVSLYSFNKMEVAIAESEVGKVPSKVRVKELKRNKQFYSIILSDSIANGFVTMSIIVMPLFLEEKNLILYYPLILLAKGLAGVLGAYISKYFSKYNYNILYACSYVVYAMGVLIFVNIENVVLMSIFYFMAFIMNSSLAPYYSKMMMETYDEKELSQVTSYIQFALVISILVVTAMSVLIKIDSIYYFYLSALVSLIVGSYQIYIYTKEKKV